MEHNDFLELIDSYIDNDISESDRVAFLEHASACDSCAEELRSAEALRDVFDQMDSSVSVPLDLQAAWRKSIIADASAKKRKNVYRVIYAAAAALVLVFGCTFAFKNAPSAKNVMNETEAAGVSESKSVPLYSEAVADSVETADYEISFAAERKFTVENVADAAAEVEQLATEYEASYTASQIDSNTIEIIVTINNSACEDFLASISRVGKQTMEVTSDTPSETAAIRVTLQAK